MTRRALSWTAAALAILVATGALGQPASSASPPRIHTATIHAKSLEGNLAGDPVDQRVAVYLPASYAASPARRYPVIYFLHGFGADDQIVEDATLFGDAMDRLAAAGRVPEMLVVVPNGRNRYGGSFWSNSPVTGNWEDFVANDLVTWVDATYRTLPRPSSRGVAGHSMGGYGALVQGMDHPDIFGAVYSLSACCLSMQADLGPTQAAWRRAMRLAEPLQLGDGDGMEEFWTSAVLGMSVAFSPNPARPPLFTDFPFREEQNALVPNGEAYAAFQSRLGVSRIPARLANLIRLRGIYLDVGAEDEFSHIPAGTLAFSRDLSERGVPHVFELYRGDHNGSLGRRIATRVLPFFGQSLDATTP